MRLGASAVLLLQCSVTIVLINELNIVNSSVHDTLEEIPLYCSLFFCQHYHLLSSNPMTDVGNTFRIMAPF